MLGIHLLFFAFVTFSFGVGNFSVGIWVYQITESIAAFTMVGIAVLLPAFLLTPLAGMLVDRLTPQRTILYGSAIASLGWIALAGLLYLKMKLSVLMPPLFVMGAFMCEAFVKSCLNYPFLFK